MGKPKLKAVEPTLEEQLDAATAAAAGIRDQLQKAEGEFNQKYPGDVRVYGAGIARFEDQEPLPPELMRERRERQAANFPEDWAALCELRRSADDADRRIRHIQTLVAERADLEDTRGKLAAAIDRQAKAAAEARRLAEAIVRAETNVRNAEGRLSEAKAVLAEATEAQARLYEQAIEQGHAPARDGSVRDARQRVDEITDELEAVRPAVAALKAKYADAEHKRLHSTDQVKLRAQAVLLAKVGRLLDEAQRLQLELEGRRQVLALIGQFASGAVDAAIGSYLEAPTFPYSLQFPDEPEGHPACAPWLAALAELACEAGAALPD